MAYGNQGLVKRIVSSPVTLVIAAVLFVVMAKAVWNIHIKEAQSEVRLSQSQAELQKLEDRKADLERKVTYLSTEDGIEAEIRTKYRAIKDGEQVAVIIDDPNTAAAANASTTPEKGGVWHWFLHLFGL